MKHALMLRPVSAPSSPTLLPGVPGGEGSQVDQGVVWELNTDHDFLNAGHRVVRPGQPGKGDRNFKTG